MLETWADGDIRRLILKDHHLLLASHLFGEPLEDPDHMEHHKAPLVTVGFWQQWQLLQRNLKESSPSLRVPNIIRVESSELSCGSTENGGGRTLMTDYQSGKEDGHIQNGESLLTK